jgi:hypothetical protein
MWWTYVRSVFFLNVILVFIEVSAYSKLVFTLLYWYRKFNVRYLCKTVVILEIQGDYA